PVVSAPIGHEFLLLLCRSPQSHRVYTVGRASAFMPKERAVFCFSCDFGVIGLSLRHFAHMIRVVVFIIAFGLCVSAVWARDERSIKKLRDALVALAPDVDPGEAELVSVTAHTALRSLAREYRAVWFSGFQNLLIHMGKRQRGYCAHYTRDIGERLKALKLKTLVLHWAGAHAGTPGENNGLVVTARNQPFEEGIVMDGWRNSGQLFWCPLKEDIGYC